MRSRDASDSKHMRDEGGSMYYSGNESSASDRKTYVSTSAPIAPGSGSTASPSLQFDATTGMQQPAGGRFKRARVSPSVLRRAARPQDLNFSQNRRHIVVNRNSWAVLNAEAPPALSDRELAHGDVNHRAFVRRFGGPDGGLLRITLFRDNPGWDLDAHRSWLVLELAQIPYRIEKIKSASIGGKDPTPPGAIKVRWLDLIGTNIPQPTASFVCAQLIPLLSSHNC